MRSFIIILSIILISEFKDSFAVKYNATVEVNINKQRRRWCSGKRYHDVDLDDLDQVYFQSYSAPSGSGPSDKFAPKAVLGSRKEIRCMSSSERESFMNALNSMKGNMAGSASEYDNFVLRHDGRVARPAHFCPSFLPWHREYLTGFERAVRSYCGSCMLPYWDNRLDNRLGGDPADSVFFSEYLNGNARGVVTTGFAANWQVSSGYCRSLSPQLRRNLDSTTASFYDDSDVNSANDVTNFQSFSYPWSTNPEFPHGYVHNSFGRGSHMLDIMCSPNDPVFFQHHAFVDLIFEKARVSMQSNGGLTYPSTSPGNLPAGFDDRNRQVQLDCARNAPMIPFDGLDNNYGLVSDTYTQDIYDYERTPGDVRCRQDGDCCANGNAEFLWCNDRRRCVSKARQGGRVNPSFPNRACHCASGQPRISNSICACV